MIDAQAISLFSVTAMQVVHEYFTVDKASWPDGPWKYEADKVQGIDEATGYDTLIVRNRGGALCGYVGVPEGHPYHGIDYDGCTLKPSCKLRFCDHTPDLSAHGGITFAHHCFDPTPDAFQKWRKQMISTKQEARRYPNGDASQRWRSLGHLIDDYEGWAQHIAESSICHAAEPGRPDNVWWFGFDCAHYDDVSPAFDYAMPNNSYTLRTYKDRRYVTVEIKHLAQQLADIAAKAPPQRLLPASAE